MSKKLLCVLPLVLLTAAGPAPETQLKPRDHQALGKLIGAYFEAKLDSSGISESQEKLSDLIAKLEKKAKGKPILSMVEDLEQALYFSRKYKDSVSKGRLQAKDFEGFFGTVDYSIHAPKSYKSSKGPYPLLIALPDRGQTPQAHFEEDWMEPAVREQVVLVVCEMPEDESQWESLEGGVGNALQVMRRIRDVYAVDVNQVFIAGRGASVAVAMRIGEMYPHLFAGVVGRAGDAPEGVKPTNFRNLPTFFAGGGANSTAFEKAARDDEIESCHLAPDATAADVVAWITETSRQANPDRISLSPTTHFGKAAYWLEIEGYDPEDSPRVEAQLDRGANTITIEGTDVSSVRIYFSDLMVDMDAPVHIIANGRKHEVTLPRRLDFTLEQAFKSGDTGRVYTNSYFVDLAARE